MKNKELIAKVKFWFGNEQPIFDEDKFIVERSSDGLYAYIYKKEV
jgi:hypothetical protein